MLKTLKKYALPITIAISALSISGTAAFYSISGLSKLFAGAAFAVIIMATALEKKNLEAHVDLCQQRYENLESRLTAVEKKLHHVHLDIQQGNKSMIKVVIGATGTIVAGLLSTIVVLLINFT